MIYGYWLVVVRITVLTSCQTKTQEISLLMKFTQNLSWTILISE